MTEPETSTLGALRQYLAVLKRQWWIILLTLLVAVGAASGWISQQQPTYGAAMKIVVGQGRSLFGADVSSAVQPFTQTMTDLLESDVVARQVIARQGLEISPDQLISRMTVTSRPDTSVLKVGYEDTDRARGTRTLGSIGRVFTGLVDERLARKAQPAPRGSAEARSLPVSATIFDPAHALPGRVSPRTGRTLAIATVLGLLAGLGLALLRDSTARRIRRPEEAEAAYGASVIGRLPKGAAGVPPADIGSLRPRVGASLFESLERLAATVRYAGGASPGVIVVTSARPEEGKSTVVAQLGWAIAGLGESVLLVEADLHRPTLHRFFGVEPGGMGLGDILRGETQIQEAIVPLDHGVGPQVNGRRRTEQGTPESYASAGLDILPAGLTAGVSPGFFMSRSAQLISRLRRTSDVVIVDTPPLLLSGDAFPLLRAADRVFVVCREGRSTRQDAEEVRSTLSSLGVKDFFLVMTDSAGSRPHGYGYGYGPDEQQTAVRPRGRGRRHPQVPARSAENG